MSEARTTLDADTSASLAAVSPAPKRAAPGVARHPPASKRATGAVSLYPPAHPAIAATLGKLTELTGTLTAAGPFTFEVRPHMIFVGGAAPAKPDPAMIELSDLLRRQLVGTLTMNAGADAESWRTLLRLLGRPAEDVRADGGIASLWATAGGP